MEVGVWSVWLLNFLSHNPTVTEWEGNWAGRSRVDSGGLKHFPDIHTYREREVERKCKLLLLAKFSFYWAKVGRALKFVFKLRQVWGYFPIIIFLKDSLEWQMVRITGPKISSTQFLDTIADLNLHFPPPNPTIPYWVVYTDSLLAFVYLQPMFEMAGRMRNLVDWRCAGL